MKRFFVFLSVFLLPSVSFLFGQTFTVTAAHDALTDTLGSEVIFEYEIQNISSNELTIALVRTKNELPAEWSSSLCFDYCFAPFVDSIATTTDFGSSPLRRGETRTASIHFFPLVNYGTGNASISIMNVDDPQEVLDFDISATVEAPADVSGENQQPEKFQLFQNHPNPFNPTTVIRFDLPEAGNTKLKIYNVLGNVVAVLLDEYRNAGSHSVYFNAVNLSSGVYFYELTSGSFKQVRKMILEK